MPRQYMVLATLLTAWAQVSTHSLRKKSPVLQDLERPARARGPLWLWSRLQRIWKLGLWSDTKGQDMIEYALMAALITLASIAAFPGIATSLSTVFSKVASTVSAAASTSSSPGRAPAGTASLRPHPTVGGWPSGVSRRLGVAPRRRSLSFAPTGTAPSSRPVRP